MSELLFLKFPVWAFTTRSKKTSQLVSPTVTAPEHSPTCSHHLCQCTQPPVTILGMDHGTELSCQQQRSHIQSPDNYKWGKISLDHYRLAVHLGQTLEAQMWRHRVLWGSSLPQHCSAQRHAPAFSFPSSNGRSSSTLKAGLSDKLLIVNAFWPIFPILPSSSDRIIANTLETVESSTFHQRFQNIF